MINRITRAIGLGFVGATLGFYMIVLILGVLYSLQYGNDPSVGGAIGLIAMAIGCPLGFTLGAIFGFRERKPNRS